MAIRLPARSATVHSRPGGRSGNSTIRTPGPAVPAPGVRLGGQIAPGDPEVQLAGADVDGDVLGRRKKNSTPLARSMTVRSRGRSGAGSRPREDLRGGFGQRPLVRDRDTQHGSHSELSVDVVEGQSARDHQHLRPVQQLADLPASASSVSCSAASHTSPASSRTFLPRSWTPPSSAATVPLPAGRVRARSPVRRTTPRRSSRAAIVSCGAPHRHGGFSALRLGCRHVRASRAWLVPAAILIAVAAGCSNTVVNTGEKAEQTERRRRPPRPGPATTSWSMRSTSSPTPRSATAATTSPRRAVPGAA